MTEITLLLEILGTIAFSTSGAVVAIEKNMDIFGVIILGLTTALGGGIARDIIIDNVPPVAFTKIIYSIVAIATVVIYCLNFSRDRITKRMLRTIEVFDSIGLGVFSVVGVSITLTKFPNDYFLAICVGVLNGVGGGVVRDLFADRTPSIFVKDFYATASLIGSIICTSLYLWLGPSISMIIGSLIIMLLRYFAIKRKWDLPKVIKK